MEKLLWLFADSEALPERYRAIRRDFADLAAKLVNDHLPPGPHREFALRALLDALTAAARARCVADRVEPRGASPRHFFVPVFPGMSRSASILLAFGGPPPEGAELLFVDAMPGDVETLSNPERDAVLAATRVSA